MTTIKPPAQNTGFSDELNEDFLDDQIVPLTAQQAQALRIATPQVSPWRVLAWQLGVVAVIGFALSKLMGLTQSTSFMYGGASVLVPAALMAVGLKGAFVRRMSASPMGLMLAFAMLEMLKLLLSVLLMLLAPRMVGDVSWLALLAGVVVALKVHWLVFGLHTMRAKRVV